jgi:RimJ/RimL family protein N-acetyltransferase
MNRFATPRRKPPPPQPAAETLLLEGDGVRLRPPLLDDAPALLRQFEDAEVSRYFVWVPPGDLPTARYYLKGFQREMAGGNAYHFTVLALPEAAPAGVVNLYHLQRHLSRAELGIWLGRPFWGRGLGAASCRLLLDLAFDRERFQEVLFRVHPENARARRAFERLGAAPVGWASLVSHRTGTVVEHRVYRMTAAAWHAQRVKTGFSR